MYQYNPHQHTKIWLSNNPDVFMNLENQVRLSTMCEKNPKDIIHLVYESTLLTPESIEKLNNYCSENKIIPVNADAFKTQLKSEQERQLFEFYKEELQHLKEGGNLAVASDILRWISPVYQLGTYTDFDFPVETANLPLIMNVEAPLLLNIGSLKIGKKEFILANNDYIAIINEAAAKTQIERIQSAIIEKLIKYETDFIERAEEQLNDSFIHRQITKLLKNRSEALYIAKSKEINKAANSSLTLRNNIRLIMSNKSAFLEFNRQEQETDAAIIKKLRKDLKNQLNVIKSLFFRKESAEVNHVLQQDDEVFLDYLMKKELNLYLKSIVICTTGPMVLSNALFGGYVLDTEDFTKIAQSLSFHHYKLQHAFKSLNSIPMHVGLLGMMRFLRKRDGEVNDSSWLESGRLLQEIRIKTLEEQQKKLAVNLSQSLLKIKGEIEASLAKFSNNSQGIFFKTQKKANKEVLEKILKCFHQEGNEHEFDIDQFKTILLSNVGQMKKPARDLEQLSYSAVVFGLTQNRKIKSNSNSLYFRGY